VNQGGPPAEGPGEIEARAHASGGISGGPSHYAWTISGLEDAVRETDDILDLGCGSGLFGAYLHERFGRKAHGLDVVRHECLCESAYASFALKNLETLTPLGHQFDLIFAIGLIEYFPNPRSFFRSLPPLLKPGGQVVITSPNPTTLLSTASLLLRGEFTAFRACSNPASITPVLAVDACRMFREAGFHNVALVYSAHGRLPLSRSLTYQKILPFLRGRLWSDNFRIVASLA
jgi:2-polyprenyl-3-methyl-5-hydroxy-6-metoxy-1,4-benzoquinol methylase